MRRATTITLWVVRLAGITQLILGVLIWIWGPANYLQAHIAIGMLVVLGLFTLAIIGLSARARWSLPIFAMLWAIALPLFGVRQPARVG